MGRAGWPEASSIEGGNRQNRLHLESRTPSWAGLPSAVLHIMEKMPLQKLCNQVASLPPTHKDALRKFLANLTESSEKEKRIIQELTIFKRINHSSSQGLSSYTRLKGCRVLHPAATLPAGLRLSISVVDSSDEATIRLQAPRLIHH